MSKGLATGSNLRLPKGINLKNQGTTGLRVSNMLSHSPEIVKQYIKIKSKTYGTYIADIWDCEDYCFLAASDIRYRFQGQPVGIALGEMPEGDHAVLSLWFEDDKKEWRHWYFDPTLNKDLTNFKPYVIIPVAPSGSLNHHELSPYESFRFLDNAAFILDEENAYKFDLIEAAKTTLTNWKNNGLPEEGRFIDSTYYSYNDQVFYWFSHIRREHQGVPVGAALGKYQETDYGALILWKSPREFVYWDIFESVEFAEGDFPDFKPRIVIV